LSKVALDAEVANSILKGLTALDKALNNIGKTPEQRALLKRDITELKTAIKVSQSS
jgi:hypothetical protein